MQPALLRLASDLVQREEPFVLLTVVRCEPPSSARVGNSALVTAGGAFHGWLGGSCTQPTAVREALRALRAGAPTLISLNPDAKPDGRVGIIVLPMACHSGGTVDIYVEPVLPAPRLLVFGISPTAQAVARFGNLLGYTVEAVDPAADQATFPEADRVVTDLEAPELRQRARVDPSRLCVVIAALGDLDQPAIRCALALRPAYLGVVASRKRFAELRDRLLARGTSVEDLERIKNPAGLDIKAATPPEIALSILAEIVEVARSQPRDLAAEASDLPTPEERDPVCGMTVVPEVSRHRADFEGRTYHFCCAGCREAFLAAPERFVAAVKPTGDETP